MTRSVDPAPGQRWVFRHLAGFRYDGAVLVVEVGSGVWPASTPVRVRFERSGRDHVTTLAALLAMYRFDRVVDPERVVPV